MLKNKKVKKQYNKNLVISIIAALLVVGITVICICSNVNNSKTNDSQQINKIEDEELSFGYDLNDSDDLFIHFDNLECNDDCSNVSSVIIDGKILKEGSDYEVRKGSVIIVIFKKVLQELKAGRYDFKMVINMNGEELTVESVISISNNSDSANSNQSENNSQNEENSNEQHSNSSNNDKPNSSSHATPNNSQNNNQNPTHNNEHIFKRDAHLYFAPSMFACPIFQSIYEATENLADLDNPEPNCVSRNLDTGLYSYYPSDNESLNDAVRDIYDWPI